MKIRVVIHEAEEGGYWAEVPAIPGCATQGETIEELLQNLYDAVEGCLEVDLDAYGPGLRHRTPIVEQRSRLGSMSRNLAWVSVGCPPPGKYQIEPCAW